MSEALIIDNNNNNNNNSNDVNNSKPVEKSLKNNNNKLMPITELSNKNVMTTTSDNPVSNIALNMQTNNLIYQKEEANLGSWRHSTLNTNTNRSNVYNPHNPDALMNASYVVSSSHTPKSLPSSLSYASQNSPPFALDYLTGKPVSTAHLNGHTGMNGSWMPQMTAAYFNTQQNQYFRQDPESLHSLQHSNNNNNPVSFNNININNNNNKPGITTSVLKIHLIRLV